MVNMIISDEDGNELKPILNADNKCYLEINSDTKGDSSPYYTGWIVLDKSDISALIQELEIIKSQM